MFPPSLRQASLAIKTSALGRLTAAEYLIRPIAVRLFGSYLPRAKKSRAFACTTNEKMFFGGDRMVVRSFGPAWQLHRADSSPFSALASWLHHPFFAQNPRSLFPFQDLIHPHEFQQTYSPRYEVKDSDENYEVVVDVLPGMKADDIKIKVDERSHLLVISGTSERATDNYKFSSTFAQSFSMDPSVDLSQMTASLDNGILTVSAPKDPSRAQDKTRTIPVTATAEGDALGKDESDDIESLKHEGIVEEKAA
jgi:HSP20 family protein